jgi:hypothetical protein
MLFTELLIHNLQDCCLLHASLLPPPFLTAAGFSIVTVYAQHLLMMLNTSPRHLAPQTYSRLPELEEIAASSLLHSGQASYYLGLGLGPLIPPPL